MEKVRKGKELQGQEFRVTHCVVWLFVDIAHENGMKRDKT